MRADQWLVHHGLAASRSQAVRLIDSGARWLSNRGWKPLSKSDVLPEDAQIELSDQAEARYVSRGGLKLEAVLFASGVQVKDKHCLDAGQSTGGFTDCLLQHGARSVVGVDVGHGQLHPRLRADSRVTCVEKTNLRHIFAINSIANNIINTRALGDLNVKKPDFELIVGDVSFISQTLLLPTLVALLQPAGDMLMLVKPQFELQPEQVGKGGIVKDAELYAVVEQRIRATYAANGLKVLNYFESAITGGDGNQEFFVHATSA